MNNHEAFQIWAPDQALWSRWAKPVLFSYLGQRLCEATLDAAPLDLSWLPTAETTAIVIDLAGATSVRLGLQLAHFGFRPVPLFNAVPLPLESIPLDKNAPSPALVDVYPILDMLAAGAEELATITLPPAAAPAFLLDANRACPDPKPLQFDNRSISFTTDFPSATFLLAHGITRALLITEIVQRPQTDLAHTLRKWQDAGIPIEVKRLHFSGPPERCHVDRPPRFNSIFQRALALVGFRRNRGGGFGNWLPDPEGHGGGG
jgi:hypothetical protein